MNHLNVMSLMQSIIIFKKHLLQFGMEPNPRCTCSSELRCIQGPIKQTNHSSALMFLSNYFPKSLSPALRALPVCAQCTHTHRQSVPASMS